MSHPAKALSGTEKRDSFALELSEAVSSGYLEALIENSPVAIVVLDAQHRFQMCNPAFEHLFQYTRKELLQNNLDNLIASDEVEREARSITERVLSGEKVHAITRRRRKDGSGVDVEVYGVPLIIDGRLRGVYGIYQDITERNRAETALRQLSGRLMQLQDEERRRIARDLHDTTAQALAALNLNLRNLQRMLSHSGEPVSDLMERTIELATQCANDIRSASYLLHPPLLDEAGLRPAILWFAEGFRQRSGIKTEVIVAPQLGRLSREAEAALFRVVQEGLANVFRHSGSSVVSLRLRRQKNRVVLTIADRGRGMSSEPGDSISLGVGIRGMRERLEQLGGTLEMTSSSRGTTVVAKLPAEA